LSNTRTVLHHDQGLVSQALDRDGLTCERMPRRYRENDLVAEEGIEDDAALPPRRADNAQLELSCSDPVDDRLRVGDEERNVNLWMDHLEVTEDLGQHRPAGPRGRADRQRPGEFCLFAAGEIGKELLLGGEEPLRIPVELAARLCRLDAAARSVEQLPSEALLECPDLQAHRRLRHTQPLGSLREALPVDHCAERRELSRVHKQSLCISRVAGVGGGRV
jgi:hypothetical protein